MAQGEGPTLDEALEKAWDKVPAANKNRWHRVEVQVKGNNPINGYRVILSPAPGG